MATMSQPDSRNMYSWWWGSHISPKNSKWLKENLKDMDVKVKSMIKLIEEDADSFARRAEMYYKKRPELMKLVEEFYRAYRSLAERYDHATGALRQAHKTMAEAFPNQEFMVDDSPAGSDPHTPDPMRAAFESDDSSNFKRNGAFTEESDSTAGKKGLKQFTDLFGSREFDPNNAKFAVRKGLNFNEAVENERVTKSLAEIETLKEALSKLEAEKEAGLVQYQQSLQRLTNLESEVSRTQQDSSLLTEKASKAEAEVQSCKEAIAKLEAEKEAGLLQYQQSLERSTNLESEVSRAEHDSRLLTEKASKAEAEVESFKKAIAKLEADKEASLVQYQQSLERLTNLESEVSCAQQDSRLLTEKASKAEAEVESFKEAVAKLEAEKKDGLVQYQLSLERLSKLESEVARAQQDSSLLIEKASKAEAEVESFKEAVAKLEAEKEDGLVQYQQSLEKLSNLESEVTRAQQDSRLLAEKASKAEAEVESFKEVVAKLEAEKEDGLVQYQQSLERLTNLELEVSHAQHDSRLLAEKASKAEAEVQSFNEVVAKLEAEKEAGLVQYQQSQERLADLESEVSRAQQDSRLLAEKASKAEAEIESFKEAVAKLEADKEASLVQYQQCLDQAGKADLEAQALREELSGVEAEKEAGLVQYKKSSEMISELEIKLWNAQEESRRISECADKAETEVETLKKALISLTEEKEALAVKYLQSLEKILSLEREISRAQEEAQRLNGEIELGVEKLKGVEERCLMLERSNQTQNEELSEKENELGRLWICIHEERQRFTEAETAFQALQGLHSQSQEELRALASELQSKAQILTDMEIRNQDLHDEVLKVTEENKGLNELNLSSAVSIKNMQDEILNLGEAKGKLEEEVEFRVDQRNALQQEIYCLKEELIDLNKKHLGVLEQVGSVGLDPDSFGLSVKELQDENLQLKEAGEGERSEKLALLDKLEIMEKLLEKNSHLEKSLSDLNAELERVREKLNALEESSKLLLGEKDVLVDEKQTLVSQLQITSLNLEKLSERNTFLENSLSDANAELEGLREKSRSLENSHELLHVEKSGLITEKETLFSQFESTRQRFGDLETKYSELEARCMGLEKEKELTLSELGHLRVSFDLEKQKHFDFTQMNDTCLIGMETQIRFLRGEVRDVKNEFEEEFKKGVNAEIEIFVLQQSLRDLEEKSSVLLTEYQKLLKESKLSEKLISELEKENLEQQMEMKSLFEQINELKMGMCRILKAYDSDRDYGFDDNVERDVLAKLEDTKRLLKKTEDENQKLLVEIAVIFSLLGQVRIEAANLETERNNLDQEFKTRTRQVLVLQGETRKLRETNEELNLKVTEGDAKEKMLETQIENLCGELLNMREENRNLDRELEDSKEENHKLDEENCVVIGESVSLSMLSTIFKNCMIEKSFELREARETLVQLHSVNNNLEEKLEIVETTNLQLKESVEKTVKELETIQKVNDQLGCEVASRNELLWKKEWELLESEKKLNTTEGEKTELCIIVEDLKKEHNEIKTREGVLNSEVKKGNEEVEMWKAEAEMFFGELKISSVLETLFENKVCELSESCQSLCEKSDSKSMEIEVLRERAKNLEGENGELKTHLAAYVPAVGSLKDCIVSLENHTFLHTKLHKGDTQEDKDALSNPHGESRQELAEDEAPTVPDGFSDLQDLQNRVNAIEKLFTEMEKLAMEESLDANLKLDTAVRQIEELKSENTSTTRDIRAQSKDGNGVLPKDILLDQVSETSSYGVSKRDDQMLELWETTDRDGSIDMSVTKPLKIRTKSSEIMAEKELGIDRLEVSRRFRGPSQEGGKKKVLERLNSDAQKLANLQITVQDLKTKVEEPENNKKGKGIEHGNVKGQLEEIEEAIAKLCGVNAKLVKNIEENSASPEAKSESETEPVKGVHRRRISEQAQRGSEKIGRLQLEVQKLQFVLLKIDGDGKESKGRKPIVTERTKSVLLRDYIYGKASPRRKKTRFCSCVRPPTKGD